MSRLPVIVAQGGIGPAGRTSGFHAYRRLVFDALSAPQASSTLASLSRLTGLAADNADALLASTLVRKLDGSLFDADAVLNHRALTAQGTAELLLSRRQLPSPLPAGWVVNETADRKIVKVTMPAGQALLVPETISLPVHAAGQLPTGFKPEALYPARSHPRGLAMTVYGASDAISSMGIDWNVIDQLVRPEQVSVYAGSSMSQLDQNGNGGMLQARLKGKRVTSKQLPLGFSEMPADFINAYILGSLGATGTSMGACATFLYNLRHAMDDIASGRTRVALVGNSEAPLTPEVIEGYATMGALASDKALRILEGLSEAQEPDYRRACRPFGNNCGFTLAESAQFFVLMDDELALQTGADILGAVGGVFVNADGHKKSISSPGAGNYITMARAAALGRNILGAESLQQRSFVQAHGTGTGQNRVTESAILSDTAKAFGIENWAVSAVKSYVGHSLATAAADQLMSTLGAFAHGRVPGIRTIAGQTADDVHTDNLNILTNHLETGAENLDMALLNAKGFGGNNATALVIAPHKAREMLAKRHGKPLMSVWEKNHETVQAKQEANESRHLSGEYTPVYIFGEGVIEPEAITVTSERVTLAGREVPLPTENPFADFV
ncbi:beta-ketoacyl synthase [Parendozoicomonas haliclonae]|uniref:Actinorhodin polyketide putative beta-ketoacyl synthase 1 n=1 Tax=Parendozoicomonas haliclonae TaxID=1960125 RepID=A0A1X7AKD6_9GAMM|nr:beta-ketoacyl synthase [Parendozoicomonas haliclonae]SMA47211.1 Actinorhodin polyketide putative beta-ketoacyl synthase 1 [Parendozoicomonas haliclonae]